MVSGMQCSKTDGQHIYLIKSYQWRRRLHNDSYSRCTYPNLTNQAAKMLSEICETDF